MSDLIRTWIVGIFAAALITAIVTIITPEGKVKRVLSLVCGFMMIITLIKPILSFDSEGFKANFAMYQYEIKNASEIAVVNNENITREIIEERYAAYISDKGEALNISLSVIVEAKLSSDGYWYPNTASISADFSNAAADAQSELTRIIISDLGLEAKDIQWINDRGES